MTEFRPNLASGMNRISKNEFRYGYGIQILIEFGLRIRIEFQNPEFAQAYIVRDTSFSIRQVLSEEALINHATKPMNSGINHKYSIHLDGAWFNFLSVIFFSCWSTPKRGHWYE